MVRDCLPISALLLAGCAMIIPAAAQDYERLDTNRDGRIDRQEWRGNMREFRDRDTNHDGYLSGDEMYGSNANGTRNRSASNNGGGNALNQLDNNRNGRVEGFEWPYNANIFHQLDRNGDSVLTQDELQGMNTVTLQDLDKNRNGRIDENEWPGGFAQFDRLDHDRDGRVSSEEYFQRGGEWQRRRRFDVWDTNQDSRLSQDEWKSSSALFRRLDKNRDGFVDWDEYMNNTDRYERPNAWR